jgi:hypothetical protein
LAEKAKTHEGFSAKWWWWWNTKYILRFSCACGYLSGEYATCFLVSGALCTSWPTYFPDTSVAMHLGLKTGPLCPVRPLSVPWALFFRMWRKYFPWKLFSLLS